MTLAEDHWFVLRNEQQIGPIRFDQLQELARREILHPSDLIWGPGRETWTTAKDIPALFKHTSVASNSAIEPPPLPKAPINPPPLPKFSRLPPPLPQGLTMPSGPAIQSPETSTATSNGLEAVRKIRRTNYIARHWRGELPLHVSYWFNGVGGYIVVTVIVAVISATTTFKDEFAPTWALLSMLLVWLVTLAAVSWQIVGAWKSASNYQRQKHPSYWGALAKVTLVIAALRTLGAFGYTGIPQLQETYQIYMGDESVGKHAFRVMRNGRELEFSGGISFGVAREFAQFIAAMGDLQTIHLNSIGGRIGEAQRIATLIKSKGLDTYVAGRCLSACTIIFLGGRNRLIAPGAKLGFHQPSFPGLTADERDRVIAAEEARLKQLGVSSAFARRANTAPPEDMWFPSPSELLAENVATRIVDPSDYAFPGLGVSDLSVEQLDEFLLGIEIYAAIKRVNPIAYEKMRNEFLLGLRQGKTAGEMRTRIAPIADKVYSDILPQASSDLLMEYARLLVAQLNFLKERSARDCYLYAKGSDNAAYEIASKYPLLDEKERAFQLKVVQAHRPNAFVVRDKKVTDAALATVFDVLQSRFGGDGKLVAEDRDRIPPEKYFAYCTVLVGFYEEVSRLPPSTGAAVLRGMLTTPIPNQPPQPPPPSTPIPNQPPQLPPSSAQKPPQVQVVQDLHLRTQPDPRAPDVLGPPTNWMPKGSQVAIAGNCQPWMNSGRGAEDADNIWCQVSYGEHRGWANAYYLAARDGRPVACVIYPTARGC